MPHRKCLIIRGNERQTDRERESEAQTETAGLPACNSLQKLAAPDVRQGISRQVPLLPRMQSRSTSIFCSSWHPNSQSCYYRFLSVNARIKYAVLFLRKHGRYEKPNFQKAVTAVTAFWLCRVSQCISNNDRILDSCSISIVDGVQINIKFKPT